jgi:hypothetical protein
VLSALLSLPMRIVRGVLENPLAAGVYFCALSGGVAVSDTWIGHLIGHIINIGPVWAPHIAFAAAVIIIVLDWLRDGIPERLAIYLTLVAPSLAMAIPKDADMHKQLAGWITELNDWLDRTIGPYLVGDQKNVALTIIGLLGILIAVIWCERYAKNGSSSMGTGLGAALPAPSSAPVTTTATPAPPRRRPARR